jgi:hypothetical protein
MAYILTGMDQRGNPLRILPMSGWAYETWWTGLAASSDPEDVAFYNTWRDRVSEGTFAISDWEAETLQNKAMEVHLDYMAKLEAYKTDPTEYTLLQNELQANFATYGNFEDWGFTGERLAELETACSGSSLITEDQRTAARERTFEMSERIRTAAEAILDVQQMTTLKADYETLWLDYNSKLRDDVYYNSLISLEIARNGTDANEFERLSDVNSSFAEIMSLLAEELLIDRITPSEATAYLSNWSWPAVLDSYAPNLKTRLFEAAASGDTELSRTLRRVYLDKWQDNDRMDTLVSGNFQAADWLAVDIIFENDMATGNYAVRQTQTVDNEDPGAEEVPALITRSDIQNTWGPSVWKIKNIDSESELFLARFTPDFGDVSGDIEVFIWYPENSVYDIKHLIHHAGGPTEVLIDQRVNFAQWVSLGSYRTEGLFNLEIHGVTSPAGGRPYADAARFVLTPDIPGNGVTIPLLERQVLVGEEVLIIAVVQPAKAYNKGLSWESDNPEVASVDNDGLLTAHAPGTATVTATTLDGGFTAHTVVTVGEANSMTKFLAWRTKNTLPDGLDGPEDDADRDGIRNLLEYALQTNPMAGHGLEDALHKSISGNRLTLTFQQIDDPYLRYAVWASSDLSDWGTDPIWTSSGPANQNRLMIVEDAQAVPPNGARFLRIEVSFIE